VSEQDIAGIFNEAIDRLAAGDSIETIVAAYGPQGTQIRPMLEAGLLTRRANYPAAEIRDSLARIDSQVLPNLPPPPTFPYWLILPLLIGAGLLIVILVAISNSAAPAIPTATVTSTIAATQTPLPIETPMAATLTLVLSATDSAASVSLFGILEADANGGFTINGLPIDASAIALPGLQAGSAVQITGVIQKGRLIASSIATATPASSPVLSTDQTEPTADSTVRLVIEGPVQRIEGNIVTILEQNIVLPETPALQVIQLGDVLRLDGQADANKRFTRVEIIFISVDVVINTDGQVWRDPGTCDSPPDWARDSASHWLARCASAPNPAPPSNNSGGSNSGGGSSGENNNDDDD
jgi:hypothetical protein